MGSPFSLLRGARRLIRGLSFSAADPTATSTVYQRPAVAANGRESARDSLKGCVDTPPPAASRPCDPWVRLGWAPSSAPRTPGRPAAAAPETGRAQCREDADPYV